MGLSKRKSVGKPVKGRPRPSRIAQYDDDSDAPSEEQNQESDDEDEMMRNEEPEEEEEEEEWDSDADLPPPDQSAGTSLANISFGDLAKAQKALDKVKRREKKKEARSTSPTPNKSLRPTREPPKIPSRSQMSQRASKNAPQEMSSKKPVSRKRDFATDNKPVARDPRFNPLAGDVNETLIRKAYGFLEDYRDKEIAELKIQIKKAKREEDKEGLKRELLVLESKKKTQQRKDRQQAVIDEHKRKEKELVAQGKTPYYLKKAELKQKVLVDQFQSMNKRQVDKAIMRKRKKISGKEKKELAFLDGRIDREDRRGHSGSGGFNKRR